MATVGIDATRLVPGGKGLARYLFEYLWALKDAPGDHRYVIFLSAEKETLPIPRHPQFQYISVSIRFSLTWELLVLPTMIRKFKLDLLHTPSDRLPFFANVPIVMYLFETPDVRNRLLASVEPSPYQRISRKLIQVLFPKSLKKAVRIMVSSKSTAYDLESVYGVPKSKLRVIYLAANSKFRPVSIEERNRIRHSLGFSEGYVLHFSSDDPRDNTSTVLTAYAKAHRALDGIVPLVIGGGIRKFRERYVEEARQLGIADLIRWAGFQSEEALVELYQGASAYFDPSLFEGFGLQVTEAMACGLPIITSNSSSLPELVGNAAFTASPLDADSFAGALVRTLADHALARQMSEGSLRESQKFSWKRHASETLEVYDEVLT